VFGLGLGFANTTLLVAVQSSVGWEQRGVATASTMLSRLLGGTLGVGALGGVLAANLTAGASASESDIRSLLGPLHGRGLAPAVRERLLAALSGNLHTVFWVVVALTGAALLCATLFPSMRLRDRTATSEPRP
jgi:hypothetical protein